MSAHVSTGNGNDSRALFAANLAAQEERRWLEYLERRTRKALDAWREADARLRQARGRA